jgi:hypothetical protein
MSGSSNLLGNNAIVSDSSFNNQMNNANKLTAALINALNAITAALDTVAVIPAPTYGAVGSYVMAVCTTATAPGATVAGSALTPSNAAGTVTGSALTGTWRAFCDIGGSGQVGLFARVS